MTVPANRLVPLLVLAGCLFQADPVHAAPKEEELASARAVRAKLTPPTPAVSFDYEGDIVIDGLWAGEVRFTARVAKVGRQAVWRVTEQTYLDHGGAESRARTLLHLDRDLSILSGTYERKVAGGKVSAVISRTETGFLVQREQRPAKGEMKSDLLQLEAAPDASYTTGALFLFTRGISKTVGNTYTLPWFSPTVFDPLPGRESAASFMKLRTGGKGQFKTPSGKVHESWVVLTESGQDKGELHWSPDGRRLLGIRVSEHVSVVPLGEGGERIKADLNEPASTWKAAFLKFGFGYHMAREELLAEAFHWELMYEHETKVLKRWSVERPLDDFRKAWIKEFMAGSKHRSILDARRLLAMTLATGTIQKQTEEELVFAAHANFGGGIQRTYYLRKKDGVWGLVRIDYKE